MIKSDCALNLLPSHGDEKAVGVTSERPAEAASEPVTTVPENCMVTVNGLEPEAANDLGQNVATIMRVLSSKFDLSGLDGVTVAHDYHGALAALDRGREGLRPLRATHAEHSVGVAMSPTVIRDGAIKTHIVLPLWLMEHVTRPETEEFRTALQVLAHECGHVVEHAAFDRALPGVLLHRTIPSLYD